MYIASILSRYVPSSAMLVLEKLLVAVEAFWQGNELTTKKAVGVTQRVMRFQERLDALLERFRAGKVKWRRRPAARESAMHDLAVKDAVPLDRAEAAAAADAALLAAAARQGRQAGGGRHPVYGLPRYYGWLGEQMPNVAVTLGSDLEAAFKTEEMCALMRATPEVARRAGPLFRMLGLDERLLLVPEGYASPGNVEDRRVYAPEPKRGGRVLDDARCFVVPTNYNEARDGRKPHPLRDPSWNYQAFVNYRSYLYYYLGRKPAQPQPT